jgi:hypothetical protein
MEIGGVHNPYMSITATILKWWKNRDPNTHKSPRLFVDCSAQILYKKRKEKSTTLNGLFFLFRKLKKITVSSKDHHKISGI